MGVQNLSLSQGPNFASQGTTSGILVYEREDSRGARDLRLVWSTEWGTPRQKQWVITMEARGYLKGEPYESSVCNVSQTFDSSLCHETKPNGDNGRVWWSHNLDIGGMLSKMAGASGWVYSSRVYDTIDFNFSVHSIFNEPLASGQTESDTQWLSVSMGYCPEYTITGAYYESQDYMTVTYSTTWTRKDDRFWLSNSASETGGMCTVDGAALITAGASGTVTAIGRIDVPVSTMTQFVAGKSVYLNVFFNATYRPVSLYFNRASGTVKVGNKLDCNGVTLTVVEQGERVGIKVSEVSGDKGTPDGAIVMVVGSHYNFDFIDVPIGGVAYFDKLPFGSEVKFSAIGYTSAGATSEESPTVTAHTASGSGCVIDVLSTGERLVMRMTEGGADKGPTVKTSPESTTVKLAGRARPSAFYGTGGESSVSFTGVVLDEDALDYEALAEKGDILMRFPDGRRYAITPTIDVARKNLYAVRVKISGSEVSA